MDQLEPTLITRKSGKVIADLCSRDICFFHLGIEDAKDLIGTSLAVCRYEIAPHIVQLFLGDLTIGFDDQTGKGEQFDLKVTGVDACAAYIGINTSVGHQAPQKIANDGTRQTEQQKPDEGKQQSHDTKIQITYAILSVL